MQLELRVRGCETNGSFEKPRRYREMTSGLLAALPRVSIKFSHGVHLGKDNWMACFSELFGDLFLAESTRACVKQIHSARSMR